MTGCPCANARGPVASNAPPAAASIVRRFISTSVIIVSPCPTGSEFEASAEIELAAEAMVQDDAVARVDILVLGLVGQVVALDRQRDGLGDVDADRGIDVQRPVDAFLGVLIARTAAERL